MVKTTSAVPRLPWKYCPPGTTNDTRASRVHAAGLLAWWAACRVGGLRGGRIAQGDKGGALSTGHGMPFASTVRPSASTSLEYTARQGTSHP